MAKNKDSLPSNEKILRLWRLLLGADFGLLLLSKEADHTKWIKLTGYRNEKGVPSLGQIFIDAMPEGHKLVFAYYSNALEGAGHVLISPEAYEKWQAVPKEFHVLYRYEERYTWHEDNRLSVNLIQIEFDIIKHTPKGCWIASEKFQKGKKFILLTGTKKYAHDNVNDAMTSFLARKQSQRSILLQRLRICEAAINEAELNNFENNDYMRNY